MMVLAMDATIKVADRETSNLGTTYSKERYHVLDAVDEARMSAWVGNGEWKALRRQPMTFSQSLSDSFLTEAIKQSLLEIANEEVYPA